MHLAALHELARKIDRRSRPPAPRCTNIETSIAVGSTLFEPSHCLRVDSRDELLRVHPPSPNLLVSRSLTCLVTSTKKQRNQRAAKAYTLPLVPSSLRDNSSQKSSTIFSEAVNAVEEQDA